MNMLVQRKYRQLLNFIKTKPKIYSITRFFFHDKNISLLDLIVNRSSPRNVFLENRGKENPDKDVYLIQFNKRCNLGFFATFNAVLECLIFAERFCLIPVVEYPSDCYYKSSLHQDDFVNTFEQFFEPVSSISIESAHRSKYVMIARPWHDGKDRLGNEYTMSIAEIDKCAHMYKKYIKIKPELENKIQKDINSTLSAKKTLGVHVRGTDFNLNFPNHPIPVTVVQYLEKTVELMKNNNFEQIFLATDEESTIAAFQKQFGNKVVFYQDTRRSKSGDAIHNPDPSTKIERENDKYLIGVEVLRDAMTLAACNSLIAGNSQVSLAARIMKRAQDKNYETCEILTNGMNK